MARQPADRQPADEDEIDDGNALAERIVVLSERLRPHRGMILAGIAAGLVAIAAWLLTSSQVAATRAQSWDAYLSAVSTGSPAAFQDVVARHPDSPAAEWSRLVLAEIALREGAELAFSDRSRSKGRLEAASQLFGGVLAAKPEGLLAERAVFGMAKAREGLGMLDEAKRGYETIQREYPFGGLAALAADHAAALGRGETRSWYDWFAAQDVGKPRKPPEPAADSKPDAEKPAESKPAESKPAESKPAESKPAESKPAETKPAGTEPAEPKPAEPKQ